MSNLPVKASPSDKSPNWIAIVGALVAVYAIVFLVLNNDQVTIRFFPFFEVRTSLIVLVLLSMGIGAVLALFGPAWWRRRQRGKQALRT